MSKRQLRIEREMIDVTSNLPTQDKDWRYTDQQDHEHYWQDGYPTLREVVDQTYWCPDRHDEHDEMHLECSICGEIIEPGVKSPSMFRQYTPGLASYYLNDVPISLQRAMELLNSST